MALSMRPLLGWLSACALTGLLDEVLVAFAAVHSVWPSLERLARRPTDASAPEAPVP